MALPSTEASRRALAPAGLGNLSAHFGDNDDQVDALDTIYYKRHALDTLPARLPNNPSPADVVYQHIHDLRMLDSNPRLNMASFVTTWMEEPARKLMEETINVNAADASIYPSCTMVEHKCVRLLADLFHAEKPDDTLGCATIGSTEAALLTGLNMKKWWQDKRKEKGLPYDKPNMIVCTSYQICWKKLAKYWDIEMRLGKFRDDSFVLRVEDVEQMVDENTIGIVGILGSTYTGHFDDIKALNDLCDKLRKERGLDIKVTVDGASGAMVAPFLFPKLVWDFQLPNVISIIVSGHKYGFVYPGIGWAIWRSKEVVHPDLIFHLNYLGTDQTNLTLNFSRPASQIVASYYQFLRLGRKGYTLLAASLQQLACYLADKLEATGAFRLLNDPRETVPLVSFTLKPYPPGELPYPHTGTEGTHSDVPVVRPYSEFEVVEKLKEYGWSVPAYKMAADADHIICCRIVIREDFSKSLADELLKAVDHALKWLDAHFAGRTRDDRDEMAERTKDIKPNKAPSKLDRMEKSHIVC